MKSREQRPHAVEEDGEEAGHARVYEPAPADGKLLSTDNRQYLERVLRLRPDDAFQISDGVGREAAAVLQAGGSYRLGELREGDREAAAEITLFVALIKGDRFEMVIEKAVELGVRRIIPVVTSRCVARPPAPGKLERWRKIALTAMLQCGGCRLPEVAEPVNIRNLPTPAEGVLPVLLHEVRVSDHSLKSAECARLAPVTWILSGPEGGFSDAEVSALIDANWRPTWLGPRRLRADTAPIAALAAMVLTSQAN